MADVQDQVTQHHEEVRRSFAHRFNSNAPALISTVYQVTKCVIIPLH
jgi:hypothetical protein